MKLKTLQLNAIYSVLSAGVLNEVMLKAIRDIIDKNLHFTNNTNIHVSSKNNMDYNFFHWSISKMGSDYWALQTHENPPPKYKYKNKKITLSSISGVLDNNCLPPDEQCEIIWRLIDNAKE